MGITDVQDSTKHAEETFTREILNDMEFRLIWFMWDAQSLAVGIGPVVGQDPLVGFPYQPEGLHTINTLGVSDSDADWYFLQNWRKEKANEYDTG